MARKEGRSREARVMGLLKEMEDNIVKEESHAYKMLHNIEDKLRAIVSNVDLRTTFENKPESIAGDNKASGGKEWTPESIDPRRPWTQVDPNRKIPLMRELRRAKKVISNEKQSGDGLNENKANDKSDTSLDTNTSRVQQLKLFWDKFFLTEMEPVKSSEVLDKNNFISEAKYEIHQKPKRKSMRKSAAKILEKSIPPSRVPISFRMVPSKQQNRMKKRIVKEDEYSDVDLLSREVSTYVAKIPNTSDEMSENDSDYTLAEESRSSSSTSIPENPSVPNCFKQKLYKIFLAHQISRTSQSSTMHKADDNRGIYKHGETGRQISCSQMKGIVLIFRNEKPVHCYTEGVIVRQEEATFIDSSALVKTKKPERKQRKLTTLLPCYYFTVQENLPLDLSAKGDAVFHSNQKLDNSQKNIFPEDDVEFKEGIRPRTTISYEKVTISSTCDVDKSGFKLVISRNDTISHLSILVIFTFSSFTILGIIIIAIKFFQGSYSFC